MKINENLRKSRKTYFFLAKVVKLGPKNGSNTYTKSYWDFSGWVDPFGGVTPPEKSHSSLTGTFPWGSTPPTPPRTPQDPIVDPPGKVLFRQAHGNRG